LGIRFKSAAQAGLLLLLLVTSATALGGRKDDPFAPPEQFFLVGPHQGKPIDIRRYRPTRILTPEEAAPFNPGPDELVVANIYHERKFWTAKIPKGAVKDVYVLGLQLVPVVPHLLLRFEMKPEHPLELLPQYGTRKPAKATIDNLIMHGVGTYRKGDRFIKPLTVFRRYYGLAYIAQSLESLQSEGWTRFKANQYRLGLDQDKKDQMLHDSFAVSQQLGYRKAFLPFHANCHTVVFATIDRMLGGKWKPDPESDFSPTHRVFRVQNALEKRGIYDRKRDRMPTLNQELRARKDDCTAVADVAEENQN
jgi:hypothetical protein